MKQERHTLSVLAVDRPGSAERTAAALQQHGEQLSVATATSAGGATTRLTEESFDCVVSEYELAGETGLDLLERVREENPDLPFILFTGAGSETVASEALSAGVTDYLRKEDSSEQYELLVHRITNAVEQYEAAQRATQLDRIRALASDVTQALVRATSRREAERRVCELITDSDPYRLAWIGVSDPDTGQVTPRASAGVEDGYLDEITVTADDRATGHGPAGMAIRERRIAVSQTVDDPNFEPWRSEAIERGYRAVAGVPLEHGETLYGVLVVYAGRPNAFDEAERELLEEIAADLGHAFHSLEIQQRLREERDQRRALFENAPGPVIACESRENGTRHVITDVNDSFEEVLGYDAEAVVGRDIRDVVVPDEQAARHEEFRERTMAGKTTVAEVERNTADGRREFVLHVIPYAVTDDGVGGWYASYTDITERKRRERKITALHDVATDLERADSKKAIYERAIEASQQILEFDRSVVDVEENGSLMKVALSDNLSIEDTTRMSVEEGIAGKTFRTGESHVIDDLQAHPGADPQGAYRSGISIPIGDHGVFQAVSRQDAAFDDSDLELAELLVRHTENALDRLDHERQMERERKRREEFTSIVSHDLRNPLNVAIGRLEFVREECDNEHFEVVAQAHDRMETLIDDLLAHARMGDRELAIESIDFESVIDRCWQNVETSGVSISVETERSIRADEGQLRHLLENLIRNAVDHGGSTVRVGERQDGFYVEDDGPGVPVDEREEIFDIKYSTTQEGTGLGLNIVQQAARAHGWSVDVTDGVDGGARFVVTGVTFDSADSEPSGVDP